MPRKIRDLIRDLEQEGFINRGGKGRQRNFVHPKVLSQLLSLVNLGMMPSYQERAVKAAIEESKK